MGNEKIRPVFSELLRGSKLGAKLSGRSFVDCLSANLLFQKVNIPFQSFKLSAFDGRFSENRLKNIFRNIDPLLFGHGEKRGMRGKLRLGVRF